MEAQRPLDEADTLAHHETFPQSLMVACGTLRGTLALDTGKVKHEGKEVTPTEFERLGGKASNKKWKSSLKVILPDGTEGGPVGNWLAEHDVAVGPFRPAITAPATTTRLSPVIQNRRMTASISPGPSSSDLLEHINKQHIGLLRGDPTAEPLPASLPSDFGNRIVLELRELSQDQLNQLSADSVADPLAALLAKPPGVRESRLAYFTGQQPSTVDREEAGAVLTDYLQGSIPSLPWSALGVSEPPSLSGRWLDLRKLWEEVQALGGFQKCSLSEAWEKVAESLGADSGNLYSASHYARMHYQRFLLPLEGKLEGTSMPQAKEADGAGRVGGHHLT